MFKNRKIIILCYEAGDPVGEQLKKEYGGPMYEVDKEVFKD